MYGLNFLLGSKENKKGKGSGGGGGATVGDFLDFPPASFSESSSEESINFDTKFTIGIGHQNKKDLGDSGIEELGFFGKFGGTEVDMDESGVEGLLGNNNGDNGPQTTVTNLSSGKSPGKRFVTPLKKPPASSVDIDEVEQVGNSGAREGENVLEANANETPQKNDQSMNQNFSYAPSNHESTPKKTEEAMMFEYKELKFDSPAAAEESAAKSENPRKNFAGVTPKKCPDSVYSDVSQENERSDEEMDEGWKGEIRGNPSEFVQTLRSQFGSTEEFCQFERYFFSQSEEVKILRGNVDSLRSVLAKTQEEKRALELQLVSERALRDQDSKNASTHLEKNNMQLNTQIYSMKCEAETWKRKAEATLKECGWLKQQLKSFELEKTEAVRKLSDLLRQTSGMDQYRISIEAYAKRQREAMNDIQKRLVDLEKAKEGLAALTEHNQKQMNYMAVHLKNRENVQLLTEKRIAELEAELIKAKSELVQNNAELPRLQEIGKKSNDLMTKLITENRDLHCGLNLLLSSLDSGIGETNADFIDSIEKLHAEVQESVKQLQVHDS